jgi:predicted nucleotidyltransferase
MPSSPVIDQRVETLLEASRTIFRENFRESSYALRAAILYGSALDPGFRSDSDIDIAVLDDAEHRLSWRDQALLMDLLERALKRGVDLRVLRDGGPSYQMHVLQHGRLIWERQRGELAGYAREALPSLETALQHSLQEWPRALSRLGSR